jgi:hypothetical protein
MAFGLAIAWTALNLLACGFFQRFSLYTLKVGGGKDRSYLGPAGARGT